MHHQLHRYFAGGVGFGFVVAWATLGATVAVVAVVACLVGANLDRLLPQTRSLAPRRRPQRPLRRSTLAARPLREEGGDYQLVPDDPSLIIST